VNCTEVPYILDTRPFRTACRRVAEQFPDCCCERESVCPEFSPGIVADDETLARFVPRKDLDLDTNEVKASLFEKATENGMSVVRFELERKKGAFQQPAGGNFYGFVTATCRDIRAIVNEEKRLFSVYDTALKANIHHADVCVTVGASGAAAIKFRRELQELFTRVISGFESIGGTVDDGTTPG
jgi:hypothetical protein